MKEILTRYVSLNLEERDTKGNTFLNVSVQMGNFEISEMLLKKGANINT
jgi:ankyrin repeat protein